MLRFNSKYVLHDLSSGQVQISEPTNNRGVEFDRYSLGYQILLDHLGQARPGLEFGEAPGHQAFGIEIRSAIQLDNSERYLIGVLLRLGGMFKELGFDRLGIDTRCGVEMIFVAQNANEFRRQYAIERSNDLFSIGEILLGHGPTFDMTPGMCP